MMDAVRARKKARARRADSGSQQLGLDRLDAQNEPESSLFLWLVKRASQLGSVQLASWLVARPNNNLLHKMLISI
jgi:hypothetical protein